MTRRNPIRVLVADDSATMRNALISDDDDVFAEHVVRLLSDRALRRSLRKNARALVETHYSPAATVASLERAYETL